MSVIRTKHNKENPYILLNKKVLFDENLSLKAKGLWAHCMARPSDWHFYVSEMTKHMKEGKRAIYAAIGELIECGYATKIEHYQKSEDGKFSGGGVEYVFFEFIPTDQEKGEIVEELKKFFRQSGFGDSRNGDSQNSTLLNKDCLRSKDSKVVCYPEADSKKISSVDKNNESVPTSILMSKTTYTTSKGTQETVSLELIFQEAVLQRKNWGADEIKQAWDILCAYKGIVNDPIRFVEGTISNLRNAKKSDFLVKRKGNRECFNQEKSASKESKENSLALGLKEPPSHKSILEIMLEEKL